MSGSQGSEYATSKSADIRPHPGRSITIAIAAVSAVLTGSSVSALTPVAPPQLYIDQGWEMLFEANGDLNGDGIDDRAVIVEGPEEITEPSNACHAGNDYSNAPVRRLLVTFGGEGPESQLAADNPTIVLRSDQGGVFGDPLEDMWIENGTVVIRHYGGSRFRWGNTLRFRFQEGDWHLIGFTDSWYDTAYSSIIEYDFNTQTGKLKRTVDLAESGDLMKQRGDPICTACRIGENCPERNGCYKGTKAAMDGTEWFDVGIKPPILMSNYHCWQEDTGMLKHLGFQSLR